MKMRKLMLHMGMVADNKPSTRTDMPAIVMGLMRDVISAVQDPQLTPDVSDMVGATETAQAPGLCPANVSGNITP